MSQLNPFQLLRLEHLAPSPTNPRKHFEPDALTDLATTIRAHGVIEPIIVRTWPDEYDTPADRDERPLYEIIAGERRYRASLLTELEDIPALVRHLDTRQVLEIQIIENLQRRGVNELEEAEGYDLMMRSYGYTADQLAEKVGKSRAYIYGRLKLTALCEAARQAFREGKLDASRALLVARIPGAKLQQQALKEIAEGYGGPMPYREAARHIQNRYMLKLKEAPFETADAFLLVTAGACTTCPQRAGNSPELFPDVDADVCTDPQCYADKKANHVLKQAEAERALGHKVILGKAAEKIAPHGFYSSTAGDYVLLDEKGTYGDAYITARKALKGADVPIVMIEDARRGRLVAAAAKKDVNDALKAAGLRVGSGNRSAAQIEEDQARKKEAASRRAIFDAIRRETRLMLNGSTRPALQRAEDLALVARQLWARTGFDAQTRLAKIYIRPDEKLDNHERVRALNAQIDDFNAAQLIQFLFDLALVGTLDVPSYCSDISTPAPLANTAASFGLDIDAIRAAAIAEKPAKAKTSPPAAPEKSPSTPEQAPPGGEGGARKDKATVVTYRHPTNAEMSWSGRGKKPEWVANYPATGGRLEELSTANQAARAGDQPSLLKPKIQAADAAKKPKEKAKTGGRVAAAGGKESGAEPAPYRCPNTRDLLEGVVA